MFHYAAMLAAAVALAGCATLPADGDAVSCDVCDTLWIRLFDSSGAPGIYRLNHQARNKPCAACRSRAMEYFARGELPARCPKCGGRLALRPVTVNR